MPSDGALAGMLGHRTHRAFQDVPVEEDVLDALLAATFSTPSKSDLQQVSVVRVRSAQRRQALADLVPQMPWVGQAPELLVFCADGRRARAVSRLRGTAFANAHLDAFLNAVTDAALHLSSCVHAARALGLGTCPISALRLHLDAVAELLELPDLVFPYVGLCVGLPAGEPPVTPRLPRSVTVHDDTYDDSHLASALAAYDEVRRAAAGSEWSTAKARQLAQRERDDLAAFLTRTGWQLD